MPNSDLKARNYARNAAGVWTPVGFGTTDVGLPVAITDPNTPNVSARVTAFGNLSVSVDANFTFNDSFEGTTFDTINRWNTYGTVAAAQSAGNLAINPGTTASASVVVNTQATQSIANPIAMTGMVKFESGTTALGNHRFWGMGNTTGNVGTSAAPLTDAIGFEVDTAGVLRASVYSSGTRVFTQTLTMPTDGLAHLFLLEVRGDVSLFFIDSNNVPVATTYTGASSQLLPVRVHSINSAAVTGTPTFVCSAMSVLDVARMSTAVSDGTYPWRKSKIDATGAMATTARPTDLALSSTATAGTGVSVVLPAAGGGQYHYISSISITKYATVAVTGSATPVVVTSTNLPGSWGYTFDSAQAIGTSVTRVDNLSAPIKSSVANTATTIVAPATTSILWRINVLYFTAP